MAKFALNFALDRDIETGLRTCMEFYGVDVTDVQQISNRVAMLRLEDDTIEWKIDGQLVMRFTRQEIKKDGFTYRLQFFQGKPKSGLIVNTSGKLLTLREDGHG